MTWWSSYYPLSFTTGKSTTMHEQSQHCVCLLVVCLVYYNVRKILFLSTYARFLAMNILEYDLLTEVSFVSAFLYRVAIVMDFE